ncbi:MAG: hypothetical protein NTW19_12565 [Planctomycetota bacterium]|nr:hypothetical protein [Planctomycetota bacterium]
MANMQNHNRRMRVRGTAMVEMVLVLPLIILVAVLLAFFGRSTARMQRTAMLDRYEVWRSVEQSPGPRSDNNENHALNNAFLNGVAQSVENLGPASLSADRGATALTSAVRDHPNFQSLTPDLADQFVVSADGRRSASFRVNFPPIAPARLALDRPFQHTHTRIGNNWQAFNGWVWNQGDPAHDIAPHWQPTGPVTAILPSARTTFFPDQAQILESAASEPDGQLTGTVRNAYLSEPGYVGPDVRF